VNSQGDYLEGEVNWTEDALRYQHLMTFANGDEQSYGILTDCVSGGTTVGVDYNWL
jgi:hypothetical protein